MSANAMAFRGLLASKASPCYCCNPPFLLLHGAPGMVVESTEQRTASKKLKMQHDVCPDKDVKIEKRDADALGCREVEFGKTDLGIHAKSMLDQQRTLGNEHILPKTEQKVSRPQEDGEVKEDDVINEFEERETDVDENTGQHHEGKTLSKSAQKKLLKMERNRKQKLERKASEKIRRHEEVQQKKRELESKQASLSAEEWEKVLQEKIEKRQMHREKSKARKDKLRMAMEHGQNLVLDLEFCDRMKQNELVSLAQQVMYSYAANAKAAVPARISLTGCTGEILSQLLHVSGFSNWLIHKEELSYLDVFQERKNDLVYLTADSDHVINELEDNKIYIIGGLVDRNRWKGLTLEKAKNQGIATGKLPISAHLDMAGSKVLTVNQVFEILLCVMEKKDWGSALQQIIPLRKRVGKDAEDDDGNANGDDDILAHDVS